MKAEIDTRTGNKEKDTMNETQATGKQVTGSESASGACSLSLSTSSVNSGSKPESAGKPARTYTYRGRIERGANYHWVEGWSATTERGGIIYPWSTKRECQSEAKRDGFKAVFTRT